MNPLRQSHPRHSRRDILKSSALALVTLAIRPGNYVLDDQPPRTANGGTDPYFAFSAVREQCSLEPSIPDQL